MSLRTFSEVVAAPHSVVGDVRVLPQVWSPQLENERDIFVYLPPSYHTSARRYPVVYMQDGQNLFDTVLSFGDDWRVDETMERLSPVGVEAIVVGVPHMGVQRCNEYSPFDDGCGDAYLAFLTDTLKPLVDGALRTLPGREHTGVLGSSMGGLISLYAALRRPDVFGFVGVMSPSLWYARRGIFEVAHIVPPAPLRIYLDVGTAERGAMVSDARLMRQLLQRKGYRLGESLTYVEAEGAPHSEAAWGERLPDALRFLLPPPPQALRERKVGVWA
jgi:predicted alpha/beta superfamily hydrolase